MKIIQRNYLESLNAGQAEYNGREGGKYVENDHFAFGHCGKIVEFTAHFQVFIESNATPTKTKEK